MKTVEAAKYIGIDRGKLAQMARNGEGPAVVYMGGQRRYRKADLDAWIASLPTGGAA
jgi:excisionase family DNA binding protein